MQVRPHHGSVPPPERVSTVPDSIILTFDAETGCKRHTGLRTGKMVYMRCMQLLEVNKYTNMVLTIAARQHSAICR